MANGDFLFEDWTGVHMWCGALKNAIYEPAYLYCNQSVIVPVDRVGISLN